MKAEKRTFQLPYFHIGKRILKSAAAVFLSLIIGMLRGGTGIPFYSAIAAILCIQPYMETSWKSAKNRLTGTFIGALYGTPVLLLNRYIIPSEGYWQIFQYAFISLAVILVIYTACIIKIPSISYFSCVVFLSIVVNHIGDAEPLIFVRDRILDTVIGVLIALFLNSLQIPRKKRKDILFVFELDEKTLDLHENLNSYSKIMMNRMISEGACFTIATPRTPASSVDIIREIHLNLPIIAMDGAVLYDTKENRFLKLVSMDCELSAEVISYLDTLPIHYFSTVVTEDVVFIYHGDNKNEAEESVYETLRKSPYRNYMKQRVPEKTPVIYFMTMVKNEQTQKLKQEILSQKFGSGIRVLLTESVDYPGYSYLKIYNRDATQENMLEYLAGRLDVKKMILFRNEETCSHSDVRRQKANEDVKKMRRIFRPYFWEKDKE